MDIFHKRFQHIKTFISALSRSSTAPRVIPSRVHDSTDALVQRIALLEQKLETLQNFEADSMQSQFSDLEDKVKLLENRVVGAGVQMGGMDFQSFEDLLAWVQIKLPRGHFGLYVDGHSLEFFTLSGHVDTEAGTTSFSHSQKADFSAYIEAQLAISFKNLFPVVFGKGGSGNNDDSECLPAINNGDKWNNMAALLKYTALDHPESLPFLFQPL